MTQMPAADFRTAEQKTQALNGILPTSQAVANKQAVSDAIVDTGGAIISSSLLLIGLLVLVVYLSRKK